jgi:rod shape-determining protein MreC
VLAGDNSNRPRLRYTAAPDAVRVGDRIVTSGEGGVFPPGVAVGVVTALDRGEPRVEPYAELSRLGYVLIANYGLADALPRPVPVARHRGPPGRAAAGDEASLR